MAELMRDIEEMVEPAALTASVSYRLRLLQIAAYKSFEKTVTDFGAAPRYYGLLKLVQANPGIHQVRLAEAIFLDRSSLVPIIETLSREGWLDRRSTERDRRVKRIFLTEEGARRLVLLEAKVEAHEAMITGGFDRADLARLLHDLDRVGANLRAFLSHSSGGEGK